MRVGALVLASTLAHAAQALMVGAAPDTPAAHVDANSPSSPWTSAVAVRVGGSTYSGVVVAPNHVLTAAHVAGGSAPAAVTVQINSQPAPVTLTAAGIVTFPGASFPYDDLTLIRLAAPVPASVQILPIYAQPLPNRQRLTLVGYGVSGQGDVGPTVAGSASGKRSGVNTADSVQTSIDASGRTSLFYVFDFDAPSGNGALGGATTGNALEAGLASGDSGSPAYAEIDGQRWLVGINNFVAPAPGQSSVDYRFGTVGGGILLSDPRFVAWLNTQTDGSLGPAGDGDVPLPAWSLAALCALLGVRVARGRPAHRVVPTSRRSA